MMTKVRYLTNHASSLVGNLPKIMDPKAVAPDPAIPAKPQEPQTTIKMGIVIVQNLGLGGTLLRYAIGGSPVYIINLTRLTLYTVWSKADTTTTQAIPRPYFTAVAGPNNHSPPPMATPTAITLGPKTLNSKLLKSSLETPKTPSGVGKESTTSMGSLPNFAF
jgi:hypothetical protein